MALAAKLAYSSAVIAAPLVKALSLTLGANSFAPLWPWDNSSGPQNSLTPDYGMIKMSITFPDETEIKFSFPGLPA